MFRKAFLLLIVVGGCVFISGCGRDDDGGKVDDNVIHTTLPSRISGMDPGNIRDIFSVWICGNIFEGLYQYHYLKRPYEVVPLLAEDMPVVSDDGLVYRVKIKEGVCFSNDMCFEGGVGRELSAEDFVYSFKRIANIKNLSRNWSLFDNNIVGLDEFREYTKGCESAEDVDYDREVEGLRAEGKYTLVIKLKRVWPEFIYVLTDIATAAMAREADRFYGEDVIYHPVGTGPFKLKKWERGSYVELARNEQFRGEAYPDEGQAGDREAGYLDDAGKMMPFVDGIIWSIVAEQQPLWLLFLNGQIDVKTIPKDNFSEAIDADMELTDKMRKLGIKLEKFSAPSVFWLGFNMEDELVGGNKALRRAISYAIDRERFVKLFSNGRDEVAYGLLHEAMASYDEGIKEKGYSEYNVGKARELVEEAKRINGGELGGLEIGFAGTDTVTRQMGHFLQKQFDAVGLEVELVYMDRPSYLEKLNSKSLQMFFSGVKADNPDGRCFLKFFYSPYNESRLKRFNYRNDEFDRIFEKARFMGDCEQRRELYREMERIVLEDCPAAFINHRVPYVLKHSWYKNYKPHVFQYGVAKYRRIDGEQRADYKKLLKKVR